MVKFCPYCREELSEEGPYCPACGKEVIILDKNSKNVDIISSEDKLKKYQTGEKTHQYIRGIILSIVVFSIVLMIILPMHSQSASKILTISSSNQYSTSSSSNSFIPIPTESQYDRNLRLANQIVSDYHKTHTYSLNDLFVCGDMSCDVWDQLKAVGINAKIQVGRIDYKASRIIDADHAWVLAEIAPGQWLALETTGGYSVSQSMNPLYYYGWPFSSPKQFKEYEDLINQYNDAVSKYNAASADYNNITNQYNNAGLLTKISLKNQVNAKQLILQQRTSDVNEVMTKIGSLLASLN